MAASDVALCNNALLKIGAKLISSLSENSKEARLCNQYFSTARDYTIATWHPGSCIKRATLTEDMTTPLWGFGHRYALPNDYLKLLQIEGGDLYKYQIENGYILSELGTEINIRYAFRNVSYTSYSVELDEAIAFYLASQLAYPLVQSSDLRLTMENSAKEWGARSKFVDSSASSPIEMSADDWLNSRL